MINILFTVIIIFLVILAYQLGYAKAIIKVKDKLQNYKEVYKENERLKIDKNNRIVRDVLLMSEHNVDELLKKISTDSSDGQQL